MIRIYRILLTRLGVPRLLMALFATAILVGAGLLMLPLSTRAGAEPMNAVDALFTATSAVCVTGLIVRETPEQFSFFGQIVILLLLQAGGLGIIAFSNLVFLAVKANFSIQGRGLLEQTTGLLPEITPGQLIKQTMIYTFGCEAVGAAILTARFWGQYSFLEALWKGVFHAVSAFCNAGFALFNNSLIDYASDPVINVAVMFLVISGGLGFIVVSDLARLFRQRRQPGMRRLSLHSRVVIITTAILVTVGFIFFFFVEANNPSTPGGAGSRAVWAGFLSISSRTAGFSTVETGELANASLVFLMFIMLVGGAPGSTAGGIKVTTFAVLCALVISRMRNRPSVEMMGRSLPIEIVGKALATTAGMLVSLFVVVLLLELTENGAVPHPMAAIPFIELLFEAVSALGTVGLSTGLTSELSTPGRVIITVCMYAGRLGPLVVAASIIGRRKRVEYAYPTDKVFIG